MGFWHQTWGSSRFLVLFGGNIRVRVGVLASHLLSSSWKKDLKATGVGVVSSTSRCDSPDANATSLLCGRGTLGEFGSSARSWTAVDVWMVNSCENQWVIVLTEGLHTTHLMKRTFPNSFGQTAWNLRLHRGQEILNAVYRHAEFYICTFYSNTFHQ